MIVFYFINLFNISLTFLGVAFPFYGFVRSPRQRSDFALLGLGKPTRAPSVARRLLAVNRMQANLAAYKSLNNLINLFWSSLSLCLPHHLPDDKIEGFFASVLEVFDSFRILIDCFPAVFLKLCSV